MISYGGLRFADGRWTEEYLLVDGERTVGFHDSPKGDVVPSLLLPPLIDPHVHTGDTFLRDEFEGMVVDLDGAVGPGGFKSRALRDSHPRVIITSILSFIEEASRNGVRWAIDFREGGIAGVERLRRASERAMASGHITRITPLGRPMDGDLDDVLGATYGLGLSAVRDLDRDDAVRWAEAVHGAGKVLALHASEEEREDIDMVLSLRPHFLVHCVACTTDDLRAVARQGVPVVICPRSNARFGLDLDVAAFSDAGVTLMLGTDNGMIADPSPLREAAFLVEEHGVAVGKALTMIENAKLFNRVCGFEDDMHPDDVTVVRGRTPEDALSADVMAVVSDGRLRMLGEDRR